MFVSLLVR